eukprot:2751182-Ditylum_brightwellii.AAC.1
MIQTHLDLKLVIADSPKYDVMKCIKRGNGEYTALCGWIMKLLQSWNVFSSYEEYKLVSLQNVGM